MIALKKIQVPRIKRKIKIVEKNVDVHKNEKINRIIPIQTLINPILKNTRMPIKIIVVIDLQIRKRIKIIVTRHDRVEMNRKYVVTGIGMHLSRISHDCQWIYVKNI